MVAARDAVGSTGDHEGKATALRAQAEAHRSFFRRRGARNDRAGPVATIPGREHGFDLGPCDRPARGAVQHEQLIRTVLVAMHKRELGDMHPAPADRPEIACERRFGADQQRIPAQCQALDRDLHRMLVQVAIVGKVHAPLLQRLLFEQPGVAVGVVVAFVLATVGIAHDAQPGLRGVAVLHQSKELTARRHGLFAADTDRRLLQSGQQRCGIVRPVGVRPLGHGLVAEIHGGPALPLPLIAAQPVALGRHLLMPTRHGHHHLGLTGLVRQTRAEQFQRTEVEAVLLRQHAVLAHIGQALQHHIHIGIELVGIDVQPLQPLVEPHGLELPGSGVAVLERTIQEGLEELEVPGVVQRETPRRLCKAGLGVAEDAQRSMHQDIVDGGTQGISCGITDHQFGQFAYGDVPQRVVGLQRGLRFADDALHEAALCPGVGVCGIERSVQLGAVHDAPAVTLIPLPPAVHEGAVQQLRERHWRRGRALLHGSDDAVRWSARQLLAYRPARPCRELQAPFTRGLRLGQ